MLDGVDVDVDVDTRDVYVVVSVFGRWFFVVVGTMFFVCWYRDFVMVVTTFLMVRVRGFCYLTC